MIRSVLVMAANDVRRRLRDRSALVTGFVAPFALAAIISLALGAGEGFVAEIGVVDEDRSAASQDLARGVLAAPAGGGEGGVRFTAVPTEAAAVEQIEDGTIGAALVVPAGFGAALAGGGPPRLSVLRDPEQAITAEVAAGVARDLVGRLNAARLSAAVAVASGRVPPDEVGRIGQQATGVVPPIAFEPAPVGGGDLELAAYFGPSMAIVFLFLLVGAGARSLLAEQREGTLARLRASPIPARGVLAAKTVSMLVLGLVSMLTLWLATTLVFGASWGPPLPVLLLCAATVFALAGISALVTAFSRTEQQAEGMTSMITFTLAILGGNFVSPGDLPEALRPLALLTPNGWALDAFTDLSTGAAGLAGIGPALAVLAAIGVVAGGVALGLFRRVVTG